MTQSAKPVMYRYQNRNPRKLTNALTTDDSTMPSFKIQSKKTRFYSRGTKRTTIICNPIGSENGIVQGEIDWKHKTVIVGPKLAVGDVTRTFAEARNAFSWISQSQWTQLSKEYKVQQAFQPRDWVMTLNGQELATFTERKRRWMKKNDPATLIFHNPKPSDESILILVILMIHVRGIPAVKLFSTV